MRRCPVCGEAVAGRAYNPLFPFCKPRCKQIDLGKWLGGDYVISQPLIHGVAGPDTRRHDPETD